MSELIDRHRAVMPEWMSLYYEQPLEIVRGEGRYVEGSDGRRYLDLFAGILTNAIGYNIAEISDAIRERIDSGIMHTSTLYLIRQQVEAAEKIARLSEIPDARVFFTASGTEANEAALLLATQYRRSNQVLAMRNSYHGRAFGTMGVTGNRGWSASSLSPVKVSYVHGGYRYRSPFRDLSDADYIDACVADLVDVIETTTSGDVACMIAEPIQGVGGFSSAPDGLFAAFNKVLAGYGIPLISDEVQTGWGRTGEHFWGIQAHGVTPDALTFAKGIGNGMTIGGVVARAELMNCLQANSISTFGGNPLSTAAASAVIDYLLSNDLQANALARGKELFGALRALAERTPVIGDVRGKGLMMGIELVDAHGQPNVAAAARALEVSREQGILIGKGGLHGNVLRLAPPMTLTAQENEEAIAALTATLEIVQKEQQQ